MAAIRALIAVFFIVLFFGGKAFAEDYIATQGYLHSFNNGISVYSGVFSLNKDVSLDTTLSFKYSVDLIRPDGEGGEDDDEGGGATGVAAVSGASAAANAGSDTRHDFMAGISHNFNNIIGVEAYYDYSSEKDYVSSTPTITIKKDLFEKNTTLTFGYSRNMDTIEGRFMTDEADRTTDNFYFGITQVISPVTVAQAGYSFATSDGQLSEGIRLVPVDGTLEATCTAATAPIAGQCVNEVFPSERNRHAYLAAVNHYFVEGLGGLLDKSALRLSFRYYDDSWEINSWMGEAEFYKYLTDNLIMRLDYRYYTQSEAFFVKNSYVTADQFKSASPQLQKKDTHLAGLKLTYLLENPVSAWKLAVNSLEGKYEYYTESIGVNAHVFMGALRFSF